MVKASGCLYSVSVFLTWALGICIHLWTIYIAFKITGLVGAIISFFLPFLSEAYWGYQSWKAMGFESSYIQWLIVLVLLWVFRTVWAMITAGLANKYEA